MATAKKKPAVKVSRRITASARAPQPAIDPIELEMKMLQLEELRSNVARVRATKELRENQLKSQELTLRKGREDEARIQKICRHRKGGRDKEGVVNILQGTDGSNYSVIHHTYPNMVMGVLCQRCQMEWRPGDTKTKLVPRYEGDAGRPNHTGFSYEEALDWPTDNEPSGASLFLIPVPINDSGMVSEIQRLQAQLASLTAQAAAAGIEARV